MVVTLLEFRGRDIESFRPPYVEDKVVSRIYRHMDTEMVRNAFCGSHQWSPEPGRHCQAKDWEQCRRFTNSHFDRQLFDQSFSLGFLKVRVIVIKEPIFAQLKETSTILTNTMPSQRNLYHCAQSNKYMIFIVIVFVTKTPKKEFAIQTSLYKGRRIRY